MNTSAMIKNTCLVLSQLLLLTACVIPRTPEVPMPYEFFANGSGPTDELIIFLPGRGDDMEAFERAGFIETLHQSERPFDAIVTDAHLGYYYKGVLAERVYQDILVPFQQKGYTRFFIVGTSLGGYGALWVNHEYGELISGVVLIAPYLGKKTVIKEIESSGGTRAWRSQLDREPGIDDKVWLWIDDLNKGDTAKIRSAILAYGEKDKFSDAAGLLSGSIPESQVFINDGGHDWKTWQALWVEIVKSDTWKSFGHTEKPVNESAD